MSIKLYLIGAGLILVILFGWYVFGVIEENGELSQANATLTQTVKDSEKENKKLKAVAELNAGIVAKAERAKTKLQIGAVKLKSEIEVLKYENAKVKKWAIVIMPGVLSDRLLAFSGKDNENRLFETPVRVDGGNTSSIFRVRNENLYTYAAELIAALKSCNKDKAGLREWYVQAGIILQ